MSYELTCESREQYLYCYVKGTRTLETCLAYWRAVAIKCEELGFKKVFVEEDLEGQLTDTEMFQVTSEMPNMGLIGIKIAYVDRHANHDFANQFGETVAVNRGIHGMIFDDVKEAKKWLHDS